MSDEPTEAPWYRSARPATLSWQDDTYAVLKFLAPDNGDLCRIAVSKGPSEGPNMTVPEGNPRYPGWVWHIDVDEDGSTATVSPSIWFHGHFHSTNPVSFRLVDTLHPEGAQ